MFHVPERARIVEGVMASDSSYGNNGAFLVESPEPAWALFLICSDGKDPYEDATAEMRAWEHVSVSARRGVTKMRIPTWKEMCQVKDLCWDKEDVVVQFHPRESEYVNYNPFVLHLWRHKELVFPTPPAILVGPKGLALGRHR